MNTVAIHGFSTQTFRIQTKQGKSTYSLSNHSSLFDSSNKIIAISFRVARGGEFERSFDDRALIDTPTAKKGYLTLVDDNQNRIVENRNLYDFVRLQERDCNIIIPPCLLNFKESKITFSTTVADTLTNDTDIEYTIHYLTNCRKPTTPNIQLDNNTLFNALNTQTIQVNIKDSKSQVISTGIPIPKDAIIEGLSIPLHTDFFGLNNEEGLDLDGELGLEMLFINLKQGQRNILEDLPVQELIPFKQLGLPYYPIEPTKADSIDWKKFKVEFSNVEYSDDTTCLLLNIHYRYV
jgi:hypothetical protein